MNDDAIAGSRRAPLPAGDIAHRSHIQTWIMEDNRWPSNPSNATLFQNVRIFDGKDGVISAPSDVLVEGQRIARISVTTLASDPDRPVTVVAGGGRVLMPGLIDAHWHAMFATLPMAVLMTADRWLRQSGGRRAAEATLMRGFTSVRDLGGPVFGLKRAIDDGIVVGPRIYPSGAFISQTSGHGDFRMPYEVPRAVGEPLSYLERIGVSAIADSQTRSGCAHENNCARARASSN